MVTASDWSLKVTDCTHVITDCTHIYHLSSCSSMVSKSQIVHICNIYSGILYFYSKVNDEDAAHATEIGQEIWSVS